MPDQADHYDIKGRKVPRVSRILDYCEDKSGLKKWKQDVGEEEAFRIRQTAANLGNRLHMALELERKDLALFENYLSGMSTKERSMLDHYTDFRKAFDPYSVEQKLHYFNPITLQEYAGTPDAVGWINAEYYLREGEVAVPPGTLAVIDYKNYAKQKNIKWLVRNFLQLAAYYHAVNTKETFKLNGCMLLVCSERQLNMYYMDNAQSDYFVDIFLDCLEHYYLGTTFDWAGLLDVLGFDGMILRRENNMPSRVYTKTKLTKLNKNKEKTCKYF